MKYTPGPWNYIQQSNDAGEAQFTIGSDRADGENKHIARIASHVGWSDTDGKVHRASRPAEANARLIASSPQLLEAIQAALDEFNAKECNCDGEYIDGRLIGHACYFHRIEQDLKDAIVKATGEKYE